MVITQGEESVEFAKAFKENIDKSLTKISVSYTYGTLMLQNWRKRRTTHRNKQIETLAKQQLSKEDIQPTILGIPWNKQDDQLEANIPQRQIEATKRAVLRYLASVYDLTGLISPNLVDGKIIL